MFKYKYNVWNIEKKRRPNDKKRGEESSTPEDGVRLITEEFQRGSRYTGNECLKDVN